MVNPATAVSAREAFKDEARRIAKDGGIGSSALRNRINSPGNKYLEEDLAALAKKVKKGCG